MSSKSPRWIWVLLVICVAFSLIGAVSVGKTFHEQQTTPEGMPVSARIPNQALYLILGAALIVAVIFGAVAFRGRKKT